MFKYLYGRMRLNDFRGETLKDTVIAVTRRADSYQHAEMREDVGMIPFNGGFCSSALKVDRHFPANFTGESISCQVSTDQYMQEEIDDELKDWDIYVAEFDHGVRRKYKVAIFVPEGTFPAPPVNEEITPTAWTQVTPEEFCAAFRDVFDDPYYY